MFISNLLSLIPYCFRNHLNRGRRDVAVNIKEMSLYQIKSMGPERVSRFFIGLRTLDNPMGIFRPK